MNLPTNFPPIFLHGNGKLLKAMMTTNGCIHSGRQIDCLFRSFYEKFDVSIGKKPQNYPGEAEKIQTDSLAMFVIFLKCFERSEYPGGSTRNKLQYAFMDSILKFVAKKVPHNHH